jgi:hypothetical protein
MNHHCDEIMIIKSPLLTIETTNQVTFTMGKPPKSVWAKEQCPSMLPEADRMVEPGQLTELPMVDIT